ncbi:MAG: DEAD/DEAH box helicase [Thermoproteales archaeon]|nr:DEAD/DEAH box helicase [Thermoproteales archaeon]
MEKILEYLHPTIKKLWYEKGFINPTMPQRKAIPLIAEGKNVLLVAPTGTGKTEAAFLPLLSKILYNKEKQGIKILYISPLRTLNRDLLARLQWWCLKTDLKLSVRHGDTAQSERRLQALKPPDILITTPETLQLLLIGKRLRETIKSLQFIIVDEIHEIADSKRGTQLSILLKKLYEFLNRKKLQIIGLSATIGNPFIVAKYIFSFTEDYEIVYAPVSKLFEIKIEWPDISDKDHFLADKINTIPSVASRARYIEEIIKKSRSVLIFTNTRPTAEILGSRLHLVNEKLPIYVHHGSLSQNQRIKIEEMLRKGEIKGIVCTSSMELGIDIGFIEKVIQYNSPREVKRLIQRIGRSGHSIGEKSKGIIIVSNTNEALESIALLKKLRDENIEPANPYFKPLDVLTHEIIGFLLSNLRKINEIYQIIRSTPAYRELIKKEFYSLLNFLEQIDLLRIINEEILIPAQRSFEYFYNNLSTIPEIRQYLVKDENNNVIGLLDDFFVSEYVEPGITFLMGGQPWEVIALGEKDIIVKESQDYFGAIPSWIGEEIPVPYDTAQTVGELREKMRKYILEGLNLEEAVDKLAKTLNIHKKVLLKSFISFYENLIKGYNVPTSENIVVEKCKDNIIIYSHFGTKINRTLGKYISYKLAKILASPIYVLEKPYYILLKNENIELQDVVNILKNTSPEKFETEILIAAINSKLFRWRLQQIARKMGVIEHDKTLKKAELDRLNIALRDTPVWNQALYETLNRDLDIPQTLKVIREIYEKRIKIYTNLACSPFTKEILSITEEYMEIVKPEKKKLLEKLILKSKILSSFITFSCNECGYIEEIPYLKIRNNEKFICPICGSENIAFDIVGEKEMNLRYHRCRKSKKGRGCRKYHKSILLLKKYGKKAVIARIAGLSFQEINEFLKKYSSSNEEIFFGMLLQTLNLKKFKKTK